MIRETGDENAFNSNNKIWEEVTIGHGPVNCGYSLIVPRYSSIQNDRMQGALVHVNLFRFGNQGVIGVNARYPNKSQKEQQILWLLEANQHYCYYLGISVSSHKMQPIKKKELKEKIKCQHSKERYSTENGINRRTHSTEHKNKCHDSRK